MKIESLIQNLKKFSVQHLIIDETLITTFPTFAKRPIINSMHSLDFLTTWIKTKREYFLIHTSYLSFVTVL